MRRDHWNWCRCSFVHLIQLIQRQMNYWSLCIHFCKIVQGLLYWIVFRSWGCCRLCCLDRLSQWWWPWGWNWCSIQFLIHFVDSLEYWGQLEGLLVWWRWESKSPFVLGIWNINWFLCQIWSIHHFWLCWYHKKKYGIPC